jgi:hypothetical protein
MIYTETEEKRGEKPEDQGTTAPTPAGGHRRNRIEWISDEDDGGGGSFG